MIIVPKSWEELYALYKSAGAKDDVLDSLRYMKGMDAFDNMLKQCFPSSYPIKKECKHEYVDVGFMHPKFVCKHCDKERK